MNARIDVHSFFVIKCNHNIIPGNRICLWKCIYHNSCLCLFSVDLKPIKPVRYHFIANELKLIVQFSNVADSIPQVKNDISYKYKLLFRLNSLQEAVWKIFFGFSNCWFHLDFDDSDSCLNVPYLNFFPLPLIGASKGNGIGILYIIG